MTAFECLRVGRDYQKRKRHPMRSHRQQLFFCVLLFLLGGLLLNSILVVGNGPRLLLLPPLLGSEYSEQELRNGEENDFTKHTRNILLAVAGNHSGVQGELEVALKSIMLNAPHHHPMTIHIMANEEACVTLDRLLHDKMQWTLWRKTPQPWRIVVYNVQSYERGWLKFIEKRLAVASQWTKHSLYRHTLGAYYRLFWDQIAADNNQTAGEDDPILYIDTDTVILANIEHLWQWTRREDTQSLLFHWGQSHCSAFMLLQSQHIPMIWELYANTQNATLRKLLRSRPVVDDQFILQAVHQEHPERVGILPPEWDISAQDGPWARGKPNLLLTHRSKGAGMLHFNGGGTSPEAYFSSHPYYQTDPLWNLAKYYVDIPWEWARFVVESRIEQEISTQSGRPLDGYALVVEYTRPER